MRGERLGNLSKSVRSVNEEMQREQSLRESHKIKMKR